MYSHVKHDQRVALAALLRAGYTQAGAAREIGVDPSTVSRELRRNAGEDGLYEVRPIEKMIRERYARVKQRARTIERHRMREAVVAALLVAHYSPEQIAGAFHISTHTTIYAWIERSRPDLKRCLRRRGKRRRKYGDARNPSPYQVAKRPIAERPLVVAERSRIGDWEGDTARGGDRKSALVVHTERKSGFVAVSALSRASADAVHATAVDTFKAFPVSTVTYDNGSEFALHRMIENDINAEVFFARPGHPEDRGTCENTIGLLREFFPKGTRFDTMRDSVVAKAVWNLNHRPRKRLSWKTPCAVFGHCCT